MVVLKIADAVTEGAVVAVVTLHSSARSLSVPGTVQLNFAVVEQNKVSLHEVMMKTNVLTICDIGLSNNFEEQASTLR